MFRAVVLPHLEVNIQASSPFLKRDVLALENVQRRATKRVRGLWYTPYPERLRLLDLFPLDYRRYRGDLILMFKIMHTPNHPLAPLFEVSKTTQTRGHQFKVYLKQCRTNVRKHSFALRVCLPWNSLPSDLVSRNNVVSFKKGVDELMANGKLNFVPTVYGNSEDCASASCARLPHNVNIIELLPVR